MAQPILPNGQFSLTNNFQAKADQANIGGIQRVDAVQLGMNELAKAEQTYLKYQKEKDRQRFLTQAQDILNAHDALRGQEQDTYFTMNGQTAVDYFSQYHKDTEGIYKSHLDLLRGLENANLYKDDLFQLENRLNSANQRYYMNGQNFRNKQQDAYEQDTLKAQIKTASDNLYTGINSPQRSQLFADVQLSHDALLSKQGITDKDSDAYKVGNQKLWNEQAKEHVAGDIDRNDVRTGFARLNALKPHIDRLTYDDLYGKLKREQERLMYKSMSMSAGRSARGGGGSSTLKMPKEPSYPEYMTSADTESIRTEMRIRAEADAEDYAQTEFLKQFLANNPNDDLEQAEAEYARFKKTAGYDGYVSDITERLYSDYTHETWMDLRASQADLKDEQQYAYALYDSFDQLKAQGYEEADVWGGLSDKDKNNLIAINGAEAKARQFANEAYAIYQGQSPYMDSLLDTLTPFELIALDEDPNARLAWEQKHYATLTENVGVPKLKKLADEARASIATGTVKGYQQFFDLVKQAIQDHELFSSEDYLNLPDKDSDLNKDEYTKYLLNRATGFVIKNLAQRYKAEGKDINQAFQDRGFMLDVAEELNSDTTARFMQFEQHKLDTVEATIDKLRNEVEEYEEYDPDKRKLVTKERQKYGELFDLIDEDPSNAILLRAVNDLGNTKRWITADELIEYLTENSTLVEVAKLRKKAFDEQQQLHGSNYYSRNDNAVRSSPRGIVMNSNNAGGSTNVSGKTELSEEQQLFTEWFNNLWR